MAKITIDPNKYSLLEDADLQKMKEFETQEAPQQQEVSPAYSDTIAKLGQNQTGQAGGSYAGNKMASSAGASIMTAGLTSGNPYAIGAGGALMGLSAIDEAKKAKYDREYQAKLARITNTQNSLAQLMQMSQGLRNL